MKVRIKVITEKLGTFESNDMELTSTDVKNLKDMYENLNGINTHYIPYSYKSTLYIPPEVIKRSVIIMTIINEEKVDEKK